MLLAWDVKLLPPPHPVSASAPAHALAQITRGTVKRRAWDMAPPPSGTLVIVWDAPPSPSQRRTLHITGSGSARERDVEAHLGLVRAPQGPPAQALVCGLDS